MYTIAELIKDLQRLDQASLVLVGCLWTRQDIREFIENNFDDPATVTDDMIDELMMTVDRIDGFDAEDITNEIWRRFGDIDL